MKPLLIYSTFVTLMGLSSSAFAFPKFSGTETVLVPYTAEESPNFEYSCALNLKIELNYDEMKATVNYEAANKLCSNKDLTPVTYTLTEVNIRRGWHHSNRQLTGEAWILLTGVDSNFGSLNIEDYRNYSLGVHPRFKIQTHSNDESKPRGLWTIKRPDVSDEAQGSSN